MSPIALPAALRGLRYPIALLALLLAFTHAAQAQTINVPADFPTIQQAINASNPGSEIVVAPGTYTLTSPLNFDCRAIYLRSSGGPAVTTIRHLTDRITYFGCESPSTILEGFTITGGGIFIGWSSPTIRNCVFNNNTLFDGAAIDIENGGPLIENCTFTNNSTPFAEGGAIRLRGDRTPVTTIRNCTFTNNRTSPNDGSGGAIRVTGRPILIENTVFSGNTARSIGGALFADFAASVTIRGCTFTGNTAANGNAILAQSPLITPTTVLIENSTFTNNGSFPTDIGWGGAITSWTRADVTVRNSTFSGNRANNGGTFFVRGENAANPARLTLEDCTVSDSTSRFDGGGLYVDSNGGRVTLRRTTFTRCRTNTRQGGAIHARDQSTVDIIDSSLLSNDGFDRGGGIYGCCGVNVTITGSVISGNGANGGGGVNVQSNNSSVTIANSTISGNSGWIGGGVYFDGGLGSAAIRNSRITGNDAREGAGIRINDVPSFTIDGCLIANNTATGCCGGGLFTYNIIGSGSRITNSTIVGNLVREGGSAGVGLDLRDATTSSIALSNNIIWGNRYIFETTLTGNLVTREGSNPVVQFCIVEGGRPGVGNTSADPLFANPATGDYRLLAGSPAIDTGSNAAVPGVLTTDLLGNPRILNGDAAGAATVDRGAFESLDCNANGLPDFRDIAAGSSTDLDANGVPDECDGLFAINARTGVLYSSIASAMAAAAPGDELRATGALFAATPTIDTQNRPLSLSSLSAVLQPVGGLYELDNLATLRTAPGQALTVRGTLRASPNSVADIAAGTLTVNPGATLLARTGSVLSVTAANAALNGQTRIEPAAVLSFDGPASSAGTLTAMAGSSLIASGSWANTGSMTAVDANLFASAFTFGGNTQLSGVALTAGTLTVPAGGVLAASGEFFAAVTNNARMVMTGDTLLVGSLTINAGASLAVQVGGTTLIGPLTNNGVITGDFRDGPDTPSGLTIEGAYTAGPDASLFIVPEVPFTASLSVRDHIDIAINNNARFDLSTVELNLFGVGPLQTLEVLSRDVGAAPAGLDRTQPGAFPIGRIRLAAGSTVQLVDLRDNDGLGQAACEALYTGTLIIEPGATLINPSCRIYCSTLDNRGQITVPANVIVIPSTPPGCSLADIVGIGGAPPADGLLTGDDFNAFISAFAAGETLADIVGIGGQPPADGLITGDDFIAFIAAFAQGCP